MIWVLGKLVQAKNLPGTKNLVGNQDFRGDQEIRCIAERDLRSAKRDLRSAKRDLRKRWDSRFRTQDGISA